MQHKLRVARVDIRKVQVDAGAHRGGYIRVHQIFTYIYMYIVWYRELHSVRYIWLAVYEWYVIHVA